MSAGVVDVMGGCDPDLHSPYFSVRLDRKSKGLGFAWLFSEAYYGGITCGHLKRSHAWEEDPGGEKTTARHGLKHRSAVAAHGRHTPVPADQTCF